MFNVSPSDVHANSYLHCRIQGGGGGEGGGGMAPRSFDLLQYFETILSLWKAFDLSQLDEVYFMGCGAAGGL